VFCAPEHKWWSDMNNPKMPTEFVVELAVAALEGNPNPLDMDMKGIGESPSDLDLPLPGKPDNRHAAGTGAARGGAKGRSLRRKKRPAAALRPKA
jgi:hypothetical protein